VKRSGDYRSAAFGQRHHVIPLQNQEVSRMQEVVRDVHAVRADEVGDWAARVLCCVGFFTLLLVAVIAVRWLS
jgi:hypothetical protein